MRALMTALSLTATLALPMSAKADDGPVVVELFTSQGCSSCPPADELLIDLAGRDDVIALALHVDYWDYIGWKDEFASPAFTRRQHAYARALGATTVYTPQFVVGGIDPVVGAKPMEVMDLIQHHAAAHAPVRLHVARKGGEIEIGAEPGIGQGNYSLHLVGYVPRRTVEIGRGENAGKTLTYVNIVTSWEVVGHWNGVAPLQITADLPPGNEGAVILQKDGPGEILAAARID